MGNIPVKHSVTVVTVLPAWKLYLLTLHVLVEGLQFRRPYLVGLLFLHVNIHALFLNLVATNPLTVAILESAQLALFP